VRPGGTDVLVGAVGGAGAVAVGCPEACVCAPGVGSSGAALGTVYEGRNGVVGVMVRGGVLVGDETGRRAGAGAASTGAAGGAFAAGDAGVFGTAAGGTATGALTADGPGASDFFRNAASTSPGLEMCERSIFVLISDSPERELRS
jgi:hypothetical protein